MDILHGIEAKVLALRDTPPDGHVMTLAEASSEIELPLERPLYTPVLKSLIADIELEAGDSDLDAAALYSQIVVNRVQLAGHIRQALQERSQITLRELIELHPLQQGLAELVAYLQLGSDAFKSVVDEDAHDVIVWHTVQHDAVPAVSIMRQARLPRVIFVR